MFAKLSTGTDESEIGRKSYDNNENNSLVSRAANNQIEGELDRHVRNRRTISNREIIESLDFS